MRQLADIDGQIDANFRRRLDAVVAADFPQCGDVAAAEDHTLFDLLHILNQQGSAPGIAIRFGLARNILDLGLLGYTVLSCQDVGQALDVIYRYHTLTSREYQVRLSDQGSRMVLRALVRPGSRDRQVVIAEEFATGFWVVLGELLPDTARRDRIQMSFDYTAPAYADLYTEMMPCQAQFESTSISLSFPREWGSLPLETADATVEAVCRAQCDELLGAISPSTGIVDDVRRLILAVPTNRRPQLGEIAAQLMTSPRTLARRLQESGTSFRRIDNEVRMGLAAQYVLLGSMSGKQIASTLGYSEPAAFYRAFHSWHGDSPTGYRRAHPSR